MTGHDENHGEEHAAVLNSGAFNNRTPTTCVREDLSIIFDTAFNGIEYTRSAYRLAQDHVFSSFIPTCIRVGTVCKKRSWMEERVMIF